MVLYHALLVTAEAGVDEVQDRSFNNSGRQGGEWGGMEGVSINANITVVNSI